MNAAEIRIRLYDYIRTADDKKIGALHALLEDTITEDIEWWKDKACLDRLDKSMANFVTSKDKGYSFTDIKTTIKQRKKKDW